VQHSIVGQVRQRPSGAPLADILVRASLLTGRDALRLGDTRLQLGCWPVEFHN
jgi:hypothetical protein